MEARRLGIDGPPVSRLGLGLAALGRPGYINLGHAGDLAGGTDPAAMRDRAHLLLYDARAHGVRYFDAARSYGRAEEFLGSWLRGRALPADQATVGSKWGYTYTAGWRVDADEHEVKDHALPVLRRQWRESREELGAHLDLYQVHSVTHDGRTLDDRPLLEALAGLKAEGVRIGITTSGPGQAAVIERAIEITVDGVRLFDTVQATWNLLERSAGPALARARAAGIGVIVKEALANGRLTARNDEPGFEEAQARLSDQARRLATTVDALALAAALAQPWADVVLSGATTVEQAASNLRAVDVGWDDDADAAVAPLLEAPEAYWRRRSGLAWT
jgi:aryl-alcohol dehydrogenase-like predicted oxidoreductase